MAKPIQRPRIVLSVCGTAIAIAFSGATAFAQDAAAAPTSPADPRPITLIEQLVENPFAQFPPVEYPDRALARGLEGYVRLACGYEPNGVLTQCEIIEETPLGAGFGSAALAGAGRGGRLTQQALGRLPPEGLVVFSIGFRLADPVLEVPVPTS